MTDKHPKRPRDMNQLAKAQLSTLSSSFWNPCEI